MEGGVRGLLAGELLLSSTRVLQPACCGQRCTAACASPASNLPATPGLPAHRLLAPLQRLRPATSGVAGSPCWWRAI